jgi:hypothetical protein
MLLLNRKGQFSIIAALLVAAVLISAVVVTYSSIRYSTVDNQPQILSSIDETNLGLKEILGFTVGYYGSVLKVTGNMTYAQQLAQNYLKSGLGNMGDVQPEWGAVFNLQSLQLNASWFSTNSYSQGSLVVNYNLTGLGIYGANYNASARLNVQIINFSSPNQAELVIQRDSGEPLINLGKSNLQFYRYDYTASAWSLVEPAAIASYANGTYVLDLPSGVDGGAYVIQINDNRGLMVLASSYTQFNAKVAWNSTGFSQTPHYVDSGNMLVGSDSNFYAEQAPPDGYYDTLTEAVSGSFNIDYYPTAFNLLGQTTAILGGLSDLQSDNSAYLQLRSFATAYSSAYNTIGFDSQSSMTQASGVSFFSWQHTTGTAGSDKLLLVSVDVSRSTNAPATVSSVTYDGVALTQVATALYISTNPQVRSYVYSLVNPAIGTKTITVTLSGTTSNAVGGSVTYTNVNQTTPILSSNSAFGSSSTPSVGLTASGTNAKVLFGHLGIYRTTNPSAYTITDNQNTRWLQTSQLYKGISSDKTVTSGSISTSWTTSNPVSWAAISVLLQPTQVGTSFTCSVEFSGTSNTDAWNSILWALDASATSNSVSVTYRLYNYTSGSYSSSSDGYLTDTLTTSDATKTQTITASRYNFRDSNGNWKLNVTATQTANTPFDLKLDLAKYSVNENNYALNLQEQFLNVNASNPRQDLCIKTGSFSNEALVVQVLHGGQWVNLMTLQPNYFNNVTLIPYIDSATLTIRLVGANDLTDNTPSTFAVDSVFIKDEPDVAYFISRQQSTFTVEVLQNGTMRWIGQNLQTSSQTIPVPPVPVKAIHVNQTVNGVNREVPFQLEDWASNYQIPLGLSSNTTVFGNRQMIVLLLDSGVSDFTVWWDGNDNATQTAMAYTNIYFKSDNPTAAMITNGNLTLQFMSGTGIIGSTIASTGTYSNSTFMRINGQPSTYGAGCSYVISRGVIRDVIMQESEWSGGATGCPNVYANIIITLPANTTYYTYYTRFMFITSTRSRSITDLCPISVNSSLTGQAVTENGTQADYPIVMNGTNTYPNYGGWTEHHFSQIITSAGKGVGIMYTDTQNIKLYTFDSMAGQSTGALSPNVSLSQIELVPVTLSSVSFTYAYDVTWQGAVATFDGQTPLCSLYDATTPCGLYILAEFPPTLTVVAKS